MRLPHLHRAVFVLGALAITVGGVLAFDNEPADVPPAGVPATAQPTQTVSPGPKQAVPPGPTFAPDGRTPDASLNAIIEGLLTDDAAALQRRYPDVVIQEYIPGRGVGRRIASSEWAPNFAVASRALYAVSRGHPQVSPPRDVDIVITTVRDGKREGWRFALDGDTVVDLYVGDQPRSLVASVTGTYERFLVLPPVEELPKSPPAHPLSTRTGDTGVDALLDLLVARDVAALLVRVQYDQGTVPEQSCGGPRAAFDSDSVQRWMGVIVDRMHSLRAVARIPGGYQPPATHLVILVIETAPYDWQTAGLLEANGRIVGLMTGCAPYPPSAFLVPPPPGGVAAVGGDRRSGHTALDRVLDALAAHDPAAFGASIDWAQVGCIAQSQGIGSPPICRPGEAEGTLIDVLPTSSCEGGYARRDELRFEEGLLRADWLLYAVVSESPAGTSPFTRGNVVALLAQAGWQPPNPTQPPPAGQAPQFGATLVRLTDLGISAIRFGCGPETPDGLLGRVGFTPDFLLAPPAS